ncbi:hypothetical protein QQZ08_007821 [Neonectria magnoliae]|uniref:Uncharacterized protein n=1 Tax=Neonectria magnoliae TaxID=2732573 RepID=A0ABR1HXR0_9HYPO
MFSKPKDRPIAILGLEKRLKSSFTTRGGYGVFKNFLERSLLGRRAEETPSLHPIEFPPDRNVPTWSWMAYIGAISHVQADFNRVDWSYEYSSSFDSGSGNQGKWHGEADGTNRPPILGLRRATKLDSTKDGGELFERVYFDIPGRKQRVEDLRCIVVSKAKPEDNVDSFMLNCYVLIVKLSSDRNLSGAYLRVGVGELRADQII